MNKINFLLIVALLPVFCFSQVKTGIELGFTEAAYTTLDEEPSSRSLFIELNKNWVKDSDKKFKLVKQVGIGFIYSSLSHQYGGMGGGGINEGYYLQTLLNISLLPQINLGDKLLLQLGPSIEGLIVRYENLQSSSWCMEAICGINSHSEIEFSELN